MALDRATGQPEEHRQMSRRQQQQKQQQELELVPRLVLLRHLC
jgi:hypothetical protein